MKKRSYLGMEKHNIFIKMYTKKGAVIREREAYILEGNGGAFGIVPGERSDMYAHVFELTTGSCLHGGKTIKELKKLTEECWQSLCKESNKKKLIDIACSIKIKYYYLKSGDKYMIDLLYK